MNPVLCVQRVRPDCRVGIRCACFSLRAPPDTIPLNGWLRGARSQHAVLMLPRVVVEVSDLPPVVGDLVTRKCSPLDMVSLRLEVESGDANLYVAEGYVPDSGNYDAKSDRPSTETELISK